jgi:hypothetical protein
MRPRGRRGIRRVPVAACSARAAPASRAGAPIVHRAIESLHVPLEQGLLDGFLDAEHCPQQMLEANRIAWET